jgi:hypothetical protein
MRGISLTNTCQIEQSAQTVGSTTRRLADTKQDLVGELPYPFDGERPNSPIAQHLIPPIRSYEDPSLKWPSSRVLLTAL